MSAASPAADLHVACLCAAWCRLCDGYAAVFFEVTQGLQTDFPGLQVHWIDIEDEAELLGDADVETFPTLVVAARDGLRFAGVLTPQAETLRRVLRAALQQPGRQGETDPAWQTLAEQLLKRPPG